MYIFRSGNKSSLAIQEHNQANLSQIVSLFFFAVVIFNAYTNVSNNVWIEVFEKFEWKWKKKSNEVFQFLKVNR